MRPVQCVVSLNSFRLSLRIRLSTGLPPRPQVDFIVLFTRNRHQPGLVRHLGHRGRNLRTFLHRVSFTAFAPAQNGVLTPSDRAPRMGRSPGDPARDRLGTIPQIHLKYKKLLSPNVDDDKAIILGGTDNLKELPGLDSDCGLMVVPEGKNHYGELGTIAA
jgi:hypothetical protein